LERFDFEVIDAFESASAGPSRFGLRRLPPLRYRGHGAGRGHRNCVPPFIWWSSR